MSPDYHLLVSQRAAEIRAGIQNGSIIPLSSWNLDATFDLSVADVYLTVLTVNDSISMAMHLVVFWLILRKTPKEMRDYRLFLLNIAVMSFIHDVQLTLYWRPVPLLPVRAGFVGGPSKIFGNVGGHWGLVTCVAVIALYIVSIICGFLYRLVSLLDPSYYRIMMGKPGLVFFVLLHVVVALFLGTLIHLSYVPTDQIKAKTMLEYPQLEPLFDSEAVFGYDPDLNIMLAYFFGTLLVIIFVIIPLLVLTCMLVIKHKLRKMKAIMSARTYKMHNNLLLALTIQMILPLVMILWPVVVVVIGAWRQWTAVNLITEGTVISCTFHSVIDNLVMILMIAPYRKALMTVIRKRLGACLLRYETTAALGKRIRETSTQTAVTPSTASPLKAKRSMSMLPTT